MTHRENKSQRTMIQYVVGFLCSLVLTLGAYAIVVGQVLSGVILVVVLGGLALAQMIIQLVFFLHVTDESRPRFRLLSFGFMTVILIIVVAGSLWIMYHLNDNMMDMDAPAKDSYMLEQKDKGF